MTYFVFFAKHVSKNGNVDKSCDLSRPDTRFVFPASGGDHAKQTSVNFSTHCLTNDKISFI